MRFKKISIFAISLISLPLLGNTFFLISSKKENVNLNHKNIENCKQDRMINGGIKLINVGNGLEITGGYRATEEISGDQYLMISGHSGEIGDEFMLSDTLETIGFMNYKYSDPSGYLSFGAIKLYDQEYSNKLDISLNGYDYYNVIDNAKSIVEVYEMPNFYVYSSHYQTEIPLVEPSMTPDGAIRFKMDPDWTGDYPWFTDSGAPVYSKQEGTNYVSIIGTLRGMPGSSGNLFVSPNYLISGLNVNI